MSQVIDAANAHPGGGKSREATRLYANLMTAKPQVRRTFLRGLERPDLEQVLMIAAREGGTPYALWRDDPVGFVEDVLGESLWSRPQQILSAIPTTRRVAVPSCFSSSKTWSAARAVLWFSMTRPPGTAKAVTMAPTWRQVVRLLWSEVRFAHSRAKLPGTVDAAQLKIPDGSGTDIVVAYGLSAAPWNEAAVQGIHAPNLLLIVDEAGGIGHVIGRNLRGMLSSEGSHMLAIGNPPTDEEASWFEGLCGQEDAVVIPISAYDTPAFTGEDAPRCLSCHPDEVHPVTRHLVEPDWVEETIREHGDDSPYVAAKVYARFPTGGPSRILPAAWVDAARDVDEPEDPDMVALRDLGLPDETAPWLVQRGAWVRLGVDVAADGGDELVIARVVGDLATIEHFSAGSANTNSMDVAGMVLRQIRRAEVLAEKLGSTAPVKVKIDAIGVGWGVAGILKSWGGDSGASWAPGNDGKVVPLRQPRVVNSEVLHESDIVPVVVSEKPNRDPDSATLHPYRKRDEMWLAGRTLLQPSRTAPHGRLRLRVDERTLAQLRAPTMATSSSGHTVVEQKKALKKRGLSSPDRAEALLLAIYEPGEEPRKRKKAKLIA